MGLLGFVRQLNIPFWRRFVALSLLFTYVCCFPTLRLAAQQRVPTDRTVSLFGRHDNDMWNVPVGSDRYYSSGLFGGRVVEDALPTNPLADAFLHRNRFRRERAWTITQHIYTPAIITQERFQPDGRPFAAFLSVTRSRTTIGPNGSFRVRSAWQFGVLGKYAAGELTQNSWHRMIPFAEEVVGWDHQVKPDLVVNYNPGLQLRMIDWIKVRAYLGVDARLGTLFTDLQPHIKVEIEPFAPTTVVRLTFFGELRGRITAYDATLRGGLINRDDRYRNRFDPDLVRGLYQMGGSLQWGRFVLDAGVSHATREAAGFGLHGYGYFAARWRFH